MKVRYWHLKSFNVEVGQHVNVGGLLGVTDNTGYSSGNHLHFEGQPMDKDAGGHPVLANPSGNIAGAISLEPYFTGIYAQDYGLMEVLLSEEAGLLTKLVALLRM